VLYPHDMASRVAGELIEARPRGWALFVKASRWDEDATFAVLCNLFETDQKRWNVAKKCIKHLDKLYRPLESLSHDLLEQLWTRYADPYSTLNRLTDV